MKAAVSSAADQPAVAPALDEAAAIDRVMRFMAIPGRSREEQHIAQAVVDELVAAGCSKSWIQYDRANRESTGQTGNLIVRIPGTLRAPRRLLMAHLDTVPLCVGCEPVLEDVGRPKSSSSRVIRSANPQTALGGDDRSGVAVVVTAAIEALRQGLKRPPLTLFFAIQEEIGLCGARYVGVSKLGDPAVCFNWDGGDASQVCLGATGDYAIEIEISGRASHAGVHPELGVSAMTIASLAIESLHRDGWLGKISKGRFEGTSNIGVIAGGEATNVVLPHLKLRAEARSHHPEFRKRIVEAYRKAFQQACKSVRSADGHAGSVEFHADLKYEAFKLPDDAPVVALAEAAIRAVGRTPERSISNGGLDANWMFAHGFPTVTLGCGQHDIHTTAEWLDVSDYLAACRVALILATGQTA